MVPTDEQVDKYIKGALQFPVRNEEQLISMVILHFNVSDREAEKAVKRIKPCYWNPDFYLH